MISRARKIVRTRTVLLSLPIVLFATASASAGLPCFHGYSWCGAPYWTGAYCGPQVPTTRTMQNNVLQSHQWKGEYPVCQPLYAPQFGHYETHWRQFPGEVCPGGGPVPELHAF